MNADTTSLVVQVILEEYRTLRTEIQHSIRLQHTTFGIGVPLLFMALGLSQTPRAEAFSHLITVAIPPLAYVVLGLWLIEMAR